MNRIVRSAQKGFTLIELMIVVAIIGILAAVAIPKFLEYMNKSKATEAEVNLNAIEKAASAHYQENAEYPQTDAVATPAAGCCAGPGRRCAVDPTDWNGVPGWDALGFAIDKPFRFQYAYDAQAQGLFVATATGDLDCDATDFSTYSLRGEVLNGSEQYTLTKPARRD